MIISNDCFPPLNKGSHAKVSTLYAGNNNTIVPYLIFHKKTKHDRYTTEQ